MPERGSSLAERLGYRAEDRVVIISCDDLGMCHALNVGVYTALRHGAAVRSGAARTHQCHRMLISLGDYAPNKKDGRRIRNMAQIGRVRVVKKRERVDLEPRKLR